MIYKLSPRGFANEVIIVQDNLSPADVEVLEGNGFESINEQQLKSEEKYFKQLKRDGHDHAFSIMDMETYKFAAQQDPLMRKQ